MPSHPKIAIIGAGNVGSTFAFTLMISGLAREIVLIDKNKNRAKGECMDMNHGASFVPPVHVYESGYEGCKDADIVVITVGAKQNPGETRIALVERNAEIFKEIIPKIASYAKDSIIIVVSNPMDILTYVTLKITGFNPNRVLGSGTVLDSSRFRYLISEHCNIDPHNVHAYIIGEHGDTELPVWSHAHVGGMLIADYCGICKNRCDSKGELYNIFEEVKNGAYKVIDAKGATYYAIGLALLEIVGAILRDENSILPVSTLIEDYYGINDVCLSIPSIVNKGGVKDFLKLKLSDEEERGFVKSANTLKEVIKNLKL
ncbi:MAG: L-lactate dehydrogenase [bacterium]